jgi:hypothetical protein
MAVSLIATVQNFVGNSFDIKPPDAPEGSTFHVIDQGESWVMVDGTWEKDLRLAKQQ